MTTARKLYSLQELDMALDRIESQKREAEQELDEGVLLDHLETTLAAEREKLQEFNEHHRLQQLEAESLRERSPQLDERLYSGAITNPRELESLEQEIAYVSNQLQQRDTELLELAVQTEESQSKCAALEKELSDTEAAWAVRKIELTKQKKKLTAEQKKVAAQRSEMAADLDQSELKRYDALRRTKGGLAVATVERGLCQACRMSLPTQQLQRVRMGRQTVLCSSCGRILLIS